MIVGHEPVKFRGLVPSMKPSNAKGIYKDLTADTPCSLFTIGTILGLTFFLFASILRLVVVYLLGFDEL